MNLRLSQPLCKPEVVADTWWKHSDKATRYPVSLIRRIPSNKRSTQTKPISLRNLAKEIILHLDVSQNALHVCGCRDSGTGLVELEGLAPQD